MTEMDLLNGIVGKEVEGQTTDKGGKFLTSLITTYTVHFPFYEDVILPRLFASGCRYNVLLADACALTRSLQDPAQMPRLAGKKYILAPMRSKGAFHPKIAMLVGERYARIFVGSHNVTESGFGYNRELSTRIELGKGLTGGHRAFFQEAWRTLEAWMNSQREYLPPTLVDAVLLVGAERHPWLSEREEQRTDTLFFGSLPNGQNLWDKIRPHLPEHIKDIFILGPFFDSEGEFIQRLYMELAPRNIFIGLEINAENISLCKQDGLPPGVSFHDGAGIFKQSSDIPIDNRYIHAKALFFTASDGQSVLVTGSANPSGPAWLAAPGSRNAEAIVLHRGSSARDIAENLNLTSIPSCRKLEADELEKIRVAPRRFGELSSQAKLPLAGEIVKDGISIPGSAVSRQDLVACRVFFENHREDNASIVERENDLLIAIEDNVHSVSGACVELADGGIRHVLVHRPADMRKLVTTPRQQAFLEFLDSADDDAIDLAALLSAAEALIFSGHEPTTPRQHSGKNLLSVQLDEGSEEASLAPLSIPFNESKSQQIKRQILERNDLICILDALIYNLGAGLSQRGDRREDFYPSEEESIGKEEEGNFTDPPDTEKNAQLLKACHGKVKTVVSRMCKRFESITADTSENALWAVTGQTLASLALLQRVRKQDSKLSGETYVPMQERKKLLDAALGALFGAKINLFHRSCGCFKEDPDHVRLLGFVIWLAWDCGIHLTNIQDISFYDDKTYHTRLLDLAKLLAIAANTGTRMEACEKALDIALQVCPGEEQQKMMAWMHRFKQWAKVVAYLADQPHDSLPSCLPKPGDLGIAIKEENPRLRLILGAVDNKIQLAELGRDNGQIMFQKNIVLATPMPSF